MTKPIILENGLLLLAEQEPDNMVILQPMIPVPDMLPWQKKVLEQQDGIM